MLTLRVHKHCMDVSGTEIDLRINVRTCVACLSTRQRLPHLEVADDAEVENDQALHRAEDGGYHLRDGHRAHRQDPHLDSAAPTLAD